MKEENDIGKPPLPYIEEIKARTDLSPIHIIQKYAIYHLEEKGVYMVVDVEKRTSVLKTNREMEAVDHCLDDYEFPPVP